MKYELWEMPTIEGDIAKLKPKKIFLDGEIESAMQIEKFSASHLMSHGKLMTKTFGMTFENQSPIVLGVCGAIKQWDGFATFWSILDEKSTRYPIATSKILFDLIDLVRRQFALRRVSFTVRSDYTEGHRFARHLGFECEGIMRSYLHDGADAHLYARIFK